MSTQNQLDIQDLLIEIYIRFGPGELREKICTLDSEQTIKNIWDVILVKFLAFPETVRELLTFGANPDLEFNEVSDRPSYSLLQWCFALEQQYEESAKILMSASKSKAIFKKKDQWGENIFGNLVSAILENFETGFDKNAEVFKKYLNLIILYGADPKLESFNNMRIARISVEQKQSQTFIEWLTQIGVSYKLEHSVLNCLDENRILLKETNLGRYILSHVK